MNLGEEVVIIAVVQKDCLWKIALLALVASVRIVLKTLWENLTYDSNRSYSKESSF